MVLEKHDHFILVFVNQSPQFIHFLMSLYRILHVLFFLTRSKWLLLYYLYPQPAHPIFYSSKWPFQTQLHHFLTSYIYLDIFPNIWCAMAPIRRVQLQGPRPAPLAVNISCSTSSEMIKKPVPKTLSRRRSPLIVYVRSPTIIHVKPQDFRQLVQSLTGSSSSSSSS